MSEKKSLSVMVDMRGDASSVRRQSDPISTRSQPKNSSATHKHGRESFHNLSVSRTTSRKPTTGFFLPDLQSVRLPGASSNRAMSYLPSASARHRTKLMYKDGKQEVTRCWLRFRNPTTEREWRKSVQFRDWWSSWKWLLILTIFYACLGAVDVSEAESSGYIAIALGSRLGVAVIFMLIVVLEWFVPPTRRCWQEVHSLSIVAVVVQLQFAGRSNLGVGMFGEEVEGCSQGSSLSHYLILLAKPLLRIPWRYFPFLGLAQVSACGSASIVNTLLYDLPFYYRELSTCITLAVVAGACHWQMELRERAGFFQQALSKTRNEAIINHLYRTGGKLDPRLLQSHSQTVPWTTTSQPGKFWTSGLKKVLPSPMGGDMFDSRSDRDSPVSVEEKAALTPMISTTSIERSPPMGPVDGKENSAVYDDDFLNMARRLLVRTVVTTYDPEDRDNLLHILSYFEHKALGFDSEDEQGDEVSRRVENDEDLDAEAKKWLLGPGGVGGRRSHLSGRSMSRPQLSAASHSPARALGQSRSGTNRSLDHFGQKDSVTRCQTADARYQWTSMAVWGPDGFAGDAEVRAQHMDDERGSFETDGVEVINTRTSNQVEEEEHGDERGGDLDMHVPGVVEGKSGSTSRTKSFVSEHAGELRGSQDQGVGDVILKSLHTESKVGSNLTQATSPVEFGLKLLESRGSHGKVSSSFSIPSAKQLESSDRTLKLATNSSKSKPSSFSAFTPPQVERPIANRPRRSSLPGPPCVAYSLSPEKLHPHGRARRNSLSCVPSHGTTASYRELLDAIRNRHQMCRCHRKLSTQDYVSAEELGSFPSESTIRSLSKKHPASTGQSFAAAGIKRITSWQASSLASALQSRATTSASFRVGDVPQFVHPATRLSAIPALSSLPTGAPAQPPLKRPCSFQLLPVCATTDILDDNEFDVDMFSWESRCGRPLLSVTIRAISLLLLDGATIRGVELDMATLRRPSETHSSASHIHRRRSRGMTVVSETEADYGTQMGLRRSMYQVYNFLEAIDAGYLDENTYHNATHAASVVWDVQWYLRVGGVGKELTIEQKYGIVLAAAAHDFQHPGVNNGFLVASQHPLAILHNDDSVLERFHVSSCFQVMRRKGCDALGWLSKESASEVRQVMINLILATDVSKHRNLVSTLNRTLWKRPHAPSTTEGSSVDVDLSLTSVMVLADLGHTAKKTSMHAEWTKRVTEEFFRQGDLENARGMPISALCNRHETNLASSQGGFFRYMIIPLFEAVSECAEAGAIALRGEVVKRCLKQVEANRKYWQEQLESEGRPRSRK